MEKTPATETVPVNQEPLVSVPVNPKPVKQCDLCPNICHCHLWTTARISDELIAILLEELKEPLLKYNLRIVQMDRTQNSGNYCLMEVGNVITQFCQKIIFTLNNLSNGYTKHKSFIDLFALTMAPLSIIMNSKKLSRVLKDFNIVLNKQAMFVFSINIGNPQTIKINMAQECHFDDNGEIKPNAIEIAYLTELSNFEHLPRIDAITYEPLTIGTKSYYITLDLPEDKKKPIALYTEATMEQLLCSGGISPYTRKVFNRSHVQEYIPSPPVKIIEARQEMLSVELPQISRTLSDTGGLRNVERMYRLAQRTFTCQPDQSYIKHPKPAPLPELEKEESYIPLPRLAPLQQDSPIMPEQPDLQQVLQQVLPIVPEQQDLQQVLPVDPEPQDLQQVLPVDPEPQDVQHVLPIVPEQPDVQQVLPIVPEQPDLQQDLQQVLPIVPEPQDDLEQPLPTLCRSLSLY